MNHGKYVFAQLAEFLPQRVFDGIVNKFEGNKYVRHFTCWNQLLCMVFGQLVAEELKSDRSTYEILQVIGISLLDKTPVNELLTNIDYKDVKELNCNQLSLNLF